MKNKNAQPRKKAELSAPGNSANPMSSMTPRQHRVLLALLRASNWISREAIDRIAGASNGPEIIRQLRERFSLCRHLHLVCDRVCVVDCDGKPSHPGRYRLTPEGRAKLAGMGVLQ